MVRFPPGIWGWRTTSHTCVISSYVMRNLLIVESFLEYLFSKFLPILPFMTEIMAENLLFLSRVRHAANFIQFHGFAVAFFLFLGGKARRLGNLIAFLFFEKLDQF